MTLSRQVFLSAMFILLCLFCGMLYFVIQNTQDFLDKQLTKHAEDTATSLGLSLSLAMEDNQMDVPVASRIVDAVWDSGYYKKIQVLNINNEVELEKKERVKFYAVPDWFIEYVKLPTREVRAQIQSGWLQHGVVVVQSNPGFAYKQIWTTFIESSRWFLLTAVLTTLLGGTLIYFILKPLRAVRRQAEAICNQQFVEEPLPWTLDLKLVVEAMNKMSRRLKRVFEEQAKATEELREQAYINSVSKMGNRRFFDLNFDHILEEKDKFHSGVALIVEADHIKLYNDKHGYEEGDYLLQQIAKEIRVHVEDIDYRLIAHLGGGTFVIVLPAKTQGVGITLATELAKAFSKFKSRGFSKEPNIAHIGVSAFATSQTKREVLSRLDMALRQAQNKGINTWHYLELVDEKAVYSSQEWGEIFDHVLDNQNVLIYVQNTILFENPGISIYETYMRLRLDDGTIVNAGMFMPMAERLNRILELDKIMLGQVFNLVKAKNENSVFTANLSPNLLDNIDFVNWIKVELKKLGKNAKQIIIELPEFGVITRVEQVKEFFLEISKLGVKTSIDNYGKSFGSFAYLNNLRLDFLKIHGSFVRNIHENEDNQFFIRSLVEIAKHLGILIIAESVETEQESEQLEKLGVDGIQGFLINKPQEYPNE